MGALFLLLKMPEVYSVFRLGGNAGVGWVLIRGGAVAPTGGVGACWEFGIAFGVIIGILLQQIFISVVRC
jgi:hypothetical protein